MLFVFATVLATAAPASATSFVPMADAELADRSPVIVEARVTDVGSASDSSLPSTDYTLEIERLVKGSPAGSTIVVRVPGGVDAAGNGLRVWGAPRFADGERVILFLAPREDGTYGIVHLFLGAFHQLEIGGRLVAVRDLSEARALSATTGAATFGSVGSEPRDAAAFLAWLEDREAGRERAADYRVELGEGALLGITERFALFSNREDQCSDGKVLNIRWFEFDDGESIVWHALEGGQPGMSDGGFAAFENALAAWNGDSGSHISMTYGGTVASSLERQGDGIVLFDDPSDEIAGSFDCAAGGTLAVGGATFSCGERSREGTEFRPALSGRIVTQDGAGCFFGGNGGADGEEIFAHELGHSLGIDHSRDGEALMHAYAHGDGRGAQLTADDRSAAASLYGEGGSGGSGETTDGAPQPPAGLSAAAVSSTEVSLEWQDAPGEESEFRVEARNGGAYQVIGSVQGSRREAVVTNLEPGTAYTFRVRAVVDGELSPPSPSATAVTPEGACRPGPNTLCLAGGRYAVSVDWTNQHAGGAEGRGGAIPASRDTGYFWFFDRGNVEMVVKVLDGRAINGHFWVFYGGLSDVEYILRVRDTETGAVETYRNPPGSICGGSDTEAFAAPVRGGALIDGSSLTGDRGGAGSAGTTCGADDRTLCLQDGRFRVKVDWTNQHAGGERGVGHPAPMTGETGTFWFFDPANVELVVKILDAEAVNGHAWVFYGALTDLGFTIEVTDTRTGERKTYRNEPGSVCGYGDTQAF